MWFVALVVGVIVLAHLYVYRRAVHDVFATTRGRRAGGVVLLVLGAVVLATFLTRRSLAVEQARALNYVGYLWLAVVLYTALLLLVGELVRLAVRAVGGPLSPGRRRFLSRAITGGAVVAAVGTVAYGSVEARRPRVERREVVLDRLDPAFDGFTVAAVSDIHLGPLVDGADLAVIVAMINAEGPDVVALVGDLVDGTVEELGVPRPRSATWSPRRTR
ncbi:hypothetical protein [Pseudonocardia lacus]|uniref:hypothetical protein n=1 Tax=Pseudonocardia lacus TaxID=2835865 RepID=UPI001BDC3112|nr:hypothetical protein [Pseudonocardia lacus]